MKSIVAPPSTGTSISVGGGQQGWLAFALPRQRSHLRIVSGAPLSFCVAGRCAPAQLDRSCEILIRAGVIAPEISVFAARNTRDRRTRACLPSASASASRSPPERASAFGLLTGAGICGHPLEPFR